MEQIHHLRSTLDLKMDVTDDNHVEGVKMETDNKQTMDNDLPAGLSEETYQNVTIREGPSSSCGRLRARSRPKLQSTKSFPPYNQCIGGLGEDGEQDNMIAHQTNLRHDDTMREDVNESVQGTERKEDFELKARCARGEVKAKWRTRRRERLGGSYEVDPDGWESARWSGKRRVEETEREREHDDEEREGGTNREWKHWRSKNSSFEIEAKEEEDEGRKRSPVSAAVEGEYESSRETPEVEEAVELSGTVEDPAAHQWSSPHPILSKILHSSSTSSSSSSINLSSAESDEVFSEGEDAVSRRRTFRKVRTDAV